MKTSKNIEGTTALQFELSFIVSILFGYALVEYYLHPTSLLTVPIVNLQIQYMRGITLKNLKRS